MISTNAALPRTDRAPQAATVIRRTAYTLVSLPLAAACFAVLVAGWSVTLSLAYTPLVVPLLVAFAGALRLVALVESAVARELLDAHVPAPRPAAPTPGFWAKAGRVLRDGAFWRRQAYCGLRMVVGLPLACLALSVGFGGLFYATAPIHYRWIPQDGGRHGLDFGFWTVDTFSEALALVPVGLAAAAAGVGLVHVFGTMWRAVAERLLPDASASARDVPEGAAPGAWAAPLPGQARAVPAAAAPAEPPRAPRNGWRDLFVHGVAAAGLAALVTSVWAVTTRDGYFWPYWLILPLATAVALHASVVAVRARVAAGWRARRATPALAIHAGAALVVTLALVGVWAGTTRGYRWWVWPGAAFAFAVGLHWVVVLSRSINVLEVRRSQAVDVQEGDLRRIERDLHDGAQARLVALGMHLGMAEQKLATDPEGARALVSEAREGVQTALAELRDLVRGIRPPVLADRGLEAAIWSLVDRTALPVEVRASIDERPTDAVETAAYFVVAEALANAAKHAGAAHIAVSLERRGTMLAVDVRDDGRGGADASGSGLRGVRQRVEALGGTLVVASPPGGGTRLHAELPCGR